MQSQPTNLLCHYGYDPLDRLICQTFLHTHPLQRFYCKSRLATEIQGPMRFSIIQHDDQLLAQQQCETGAPDATLMATDQQRSVLQMFNAIHPRQPIVYSPYGHRPITSGFHSLLGFNGERPDPVTGCYLLGNGYRAFNPVLMRFNSPDSWSPFGKGGLNSYAYCKGDPINKVDPTGHGRIPLYPAMKSKILGRRQRINTFKKNRTLDRGRGIVNPKLTAEQAIKIHDQAREIDRVMTDIGERKHALIEFDYNNRNSPILKNIASASVADHRLPLHNLPQKLQEFAKVPAVPPNSKDLLEVIYHPDKNAVVELSLITDGSPTLHPSERPIDINTAKAYEIRINMQYSEYYEAHAEWLKFDKMLYPR